MLPIYFNYLPRVAVAVTPAAAAVAVVVYITSSLAKKLNMRNQFQSVTIVVAALGALNSDGEAAQGLRASFDLTSVNKNVFKGQQQLRSFNILIAACCKVSADTCN